MASTKDDGRQLDTMYGRALVPLDGSDAAEIVLPYAEEFAAKLNSKIVLVGVSESTAALTEQTYQSYLEHVAERLRDQLGRRLSKGEARVVSEVLVGKPTDRILHYATEAHADLLIMASHPSGEGPWPLGNVVAKVLRAISIPVLLIKGPAKPEALEDKMLLRRVLLPLDGSKLGEAAVPHVEILAQSLSAELVLLYVVDPLIVQPLYGPLMSYSLPVPQGEEARKSEANDYLNSVVTALKEKGINASGEIVLGSPADQIIEYAERSNIDLIAMATHGRSGVGRWVFGSVTDKVLHARDVAVLVVRPTRT
jgi:nucleotide-binding universal stress UspA family protein